jgi:hypothetical protein
MGYPPGGRGYRVRSLKMNHFFTSNNVIFDENIPYRAIHTLPTSEISYDSFPFAISDPAPDSPASSSSTDNLVTCVVGHCFAWQYESLHKLNLTVLYIKTCIAMQSIAY